MSLWSRITSFFSSSSATHASPNEKEDEDFWQQVYTEREKYFREKFGELPDDILKIAHMFGVWPGGGLYAFPATVIGERIRAYTTFGFTNADMPASVTVSDVDVQQDEQGRTTKSSTRLQQKMRVDTGNGRAGYGYEIVVLTKDDSEWPLWVLQWAANAEILNDVGMLNRVEKFNGLTVQDIQVGESEDEKVNLLIAKADAPLPTGTTLPNGRMEIIIATVITNYEMQWSMSNGRDSLLKKMREAGVGQLSDRQRQSVVENG